MHHIIEEYPRKFSRIANERHLDLNKEMREHFCAPEPKKKKPRKQKKAKKNRRKKK